jgi:hypothetical protein
VGLVALRGRRHDDIDVMDFGGLVSCRGLVEPRMGIGCQDIGNYLTQLMVELDFALGRVAAKCAK